MSTTTAPVDDAALWEEYRRTGSVEVRNRLVERHMGMVGRIAYRVRGEIPPASLLSYHDLISEGAIGLTGAVERFNPSTGVQFVTFAWRRIHGAMRDAMRSQDWVKRTDRKRLGKTARIIGEMPLHRHESTGHESGRYTDFEDAIPDHRESPEIADDWLSGREYGCLSDRERSVVRMYFEEDLTMKVIGGRLGLVESRVSQMVAQILNKLRKALPCTETA